MIQFDPVTYSVTEGGSTMLRIVKIGNADIPVSVDISTVVGTAGDSSVNCCVYVCCVLLKSAVYHATMYLVLHNTSLPHFRVG